MGSDPSERVPGAKPSVDAQDEPAGSNWPESEGYRSEIELVQALLTGDARAWRLLFERYGSVVREEIEGVLRRVSGDVSDAEDVFATFSGSLVSKDMYKLRGFDLARGVRLGTWLVMLAKNAAWDHLRARQRRERLFKIGDTVDHVSPFDALAEKEELARVRDALSTLSERDRSFMDLWMQGLSAQHIAEELQISVNTVRSKKYKIGARLASVRARKVAADELSRGMDWSRQRELREEDPVDSGDQFAASMLQGAISTYDASLKLLAGITASTAHILDLLAEPVG